MSRQTERDLRMDLMGQVAEYAERNRRLERELRLRGRIRKDEKLLHGYAIADSSNVLYIGWLPENVMVVWFGKPGKSDRMSVYEYLGVSRQRVVACALAPSTGEYINRVIKPRYQAVKIS